MTGAFLVVLAALVLGGLLGNLHAPPRFRLRQFGRVRGDFFWERIAAAGIPVVPLPAAGPICGRARKEGIYDTGWFNHRDPFYSYIPMFQNFNSFAGHGRGSQASGKPYRPARYTFAELERMKSRRS